MNSEYLVRKETMEAIADEIRDVSGNDYKQRPQQMLESLQNVNREVETQKTEIEGLVELIADKADPDIMAGNYYPEVNEMGGLTYTINADGFSSSKPLEEKDVCFYDYDGTLLYSYTVDEIQAMTELPPLPYHKGLICQGWNWTLEDLQEEGSLMDVGAQYTTDDGKTRLYVSVYDLLASAIKLCMMKSSGGSVTIDWGDGTEPVVFTDVDTIEFSHTYTVEGNYVIEISANDCTVRLGDGTTGFIVADNILHRVEIGDGVTTIDKRAFSGCYSLESVTLPTTISFIDYHTFYSCASLRFIVFPRVSRFDSANGYFSDCSNLRGVSLPNSFPTMGSNFITGPNKVSRFCIPDSVTRLDQFFRQEDVSKVLTTLKLPKTIVQYNTSVFYGQRALTRIIFPKSYPSRSFQFVFQDCWNLRHVEIPESITTIEHYAFCRCHSLHRLDIPPSVVIVASYFALGSGLRILSFERHTAVPMAYSSSFINFPTSCKILVPAALYDEWIAAKYWTSVSSQIVPV